MSQFAFARATGIAADEAPRILAFTPRNRIAAPDDPTDMVTRARLERRNRRCPRCGRVTVEAVEHEDALLDRHCRPIPGTASIAGFFCNACLHEWPARLPRLALCR
jgi:hypothetical protein